MEKQQENAGKQLETTTYNVIILDKSGSMMSIARQAIEGVNETIAAIRRTEEKNPQQRQVVTLVAFCGCERKLIFDEVPVKETRRITARDYQPCCSTPLYDAVGEAITKLHGKVEGKENVLENITIITDGYENASREFSGRSLKALIEAYKNEGWLFSYIGADHDVESVAFSLNIDNAMQFDKTDEGVNDMFSNYRASLADWEANQVQCMKIAEDRQLPSGVRRKMRINANKNFFKKR